MVPPFNPSGVIAEAADLLRQYGLHTTSGDRYAPGFVTEAFAAHNIKYIPSERDRSQIYLDLLPAVNAGRVRLLDDPELLRELRGLERRRGATGRDKVDHRHGFHDDRANAAAGALTRVLQPRRALLFSGGYDPELTVDQQQACLDRQTKEAAAASAASVQEEIFKKGVWGFSNW